MNRRNWLELSRKLVDQYDMDYSFNAVQAALGEAALSYWGEGVLITSEYPTPFPINLNAGDLGYLVGDGIAYDPNGQITRIDPSSTTPHSGFIPTPDPTNPRWDLICISYLMSGSVLIPKPSDPIVSVDLNLIDDFVLHYVEGTPSPTPAYPAKPAGSVILWGLRVPPAITHANQAVADLSVREMAQAGIFNYPVFKQEVPTGVVDGTNKTFTLSLPPVSNQSVLVMVDDLVLEDTEFTQPSAQVVLLGTAPVPGQSVYVWYVVNQNTSQNPVTGRQEAPTGVVNGINDTFTLSGQPISQQSTMVFVDGMAKEASTWSLQQGLLTSSIKFGAGNIPAPGQSVYVFYLINVSPNFGNNGGGSDFTRAKERVILSPTDIANGYIILMHLGLPLSFVAGVQGLGLVEESLDSGATGDYVMTVDGGSGHSKLTWANDLSSLGATPLESGDVIFVQYEY